MSGPTVRCTVDLGPRRARPAALRPEAKAEPVVAPPTTTGAPLQPTGPASPAARVLALAHWIERQVRVGRFRSYRDAARHLGVSHARVQHVVGLVFLPAAVQADVLLGRRTFRERDLRELAATASWPSLS